MFTKVNSLVFATIILATVLFFPWYWGIDGPFYRVLDNDSIIIGQALAFNANLVQSFFDNSYFLILLLSGWLELFSWMGGIPIADMHALYSHQPHLLQNFSEITTVSRVFTIVCVVCFVATFIYFTYRFTSDKPLALFAGWLLSLSPGLFFQSLMIRPELLSCLFFMVALFLMILPAKSGRLSERDFFVTGVCAYLAFLCKIQSILLFLSLPILIGVFWFPLRHKRLRFRLKNKQVLGYTFLAFMLSIPLAYDTIIALWVEHNISPYVFFAYWIAAVVILHRFYIQDKVTSWGCFIMGWAGMAVAYYVNFFHFHPLNHIYIPYFYEVAQAFTRPDAQLQTGSFLAKALLSTIHDKATLSGSFDFYPFALLYWVVIGIIGILLWKKQWLTLFQVTSLMGLSLTLEIIFRVRDYLQYYYIYTEFLVILSFLIGWIKIKESFSMKRNHRVVLLGIATIPLAFLFKTNMDFIENSLTHQSWISQNPTRFCTYHDLYSPLLALPLQANQQHCVEHIENPIAYSQQKIEIIPPRILDLYTNTHMTFMERLQNPQQYKNQLNLILDTNLSKKQYYFQAGLYFLKENKLDKAIREFSKVIYIHPHTFQAYLFRGEILLDLEKYEDAIRDFSVLIQHTPSAQAYQSRGFAYAQQQQWEPAISDFQASIEIEPQNPQHYFNLGNVLLDSHQISRACERFQQVCDLGQCDIVKAVMVTNC